MFTLHKEAVNCVHYSPVVENFFAAIHEMNVLKGMTGSKKVWMIKVYLKGLKKILKFLKPVVWLFFYDCNLFKTHINYLIFNKTLLNFSLRNIYYYI